MRIVDGKIVMDGSDETPSDESPPVESTADTDSIYPRCDACGEVNYEWQPGTRGRKPKWHDACRPTAPNRSSTSPRRSTGIRNENALRESLHARYEQIAQVLGLIHPAYSAGIRDKIEAAVEADIQYARTNPAFRRMLESGLEKSALAAVIGIHVSMLQPVVIDVNRRRRNVRKTPPAPSGDGSGGEREAPPGPPTRQGSGEGFSATVHEFPAASSNTAPDPGSETMNAAALPGMPG